MLVGKYDMHIIRNSSNYNRDFHKLSAGSLKMRESAFLKMNIGLTKIMHFQ